jgi:hypothetical protein
MSALLDTIFVNHPQLHPRNAPSIDTPTTSSNSSDRNAIVIDNDSGSQSSEATQSQPCDVPPLEVVASPPLISMPPPTTNIINTNGEQLQSTSASNISQSPIVSAAGGGSNHVLSPSSWLRSSLSFVTSLFTQAAAPPSPSSSSSTITPSSESPVSTNLPSSSSTAATTTTMNTATSIGLPIPVELLSNVASSSPSKSNDTKEIITITDDSSNIKTDSSKGNNNKDDAAIVPHRLGRAEQALAAIRAAANNIEKRAAHLPLIAVVGLDIGNFDDITQLLDVLI